MKDKKAKLLTGIVLSLPVLSFAHLHSGPYVGVGIGSQNFSTRMNSVLSQNLDPILVTPVGTIDQVIFDHKAAINGVIGDVYIGWQYYCNEFWGALEGEYQFGSNKSHIRKFDSQFRTGPGTGITANVSLRAQEQFSLSLLLGYEAICNVAFYIRGGYQQADFKSSAIEGGEIGFTGNFSKNISGYLLGLGVQSEICQGFGLRLEYRYVGFNDSFTKVSQSPEWTFPATNLTPELPGIVATKYKNQQDNQMILSANYVFDLCL